ncbi:chemotaxis protein CheB [Pseudomonas sp. Q2-TVG4-2]|uniref:chemotaxis protein CheB n=1 Tax=Pseudomonas sp. Q2-TVG4-2 TaxID=1685699 RepID=UPI0015E70E70|nr:chemotaxis protein CheB [Pseudomonas sp. Q2-TVG4-2]
MRVLVVDDSVVVRTLLQAVLESNGAEVRVAESGEQALEMLERYTPDIVTMDVHMPGMDGYTTISRILKQYALPVVVLTASASAADSATAMKGLDVGALAVLEKPTGPDAPDFAQRIDQLMRTLRVMSQVKVVRRHRPVTERISAAPTALVGQAAISAPKLVAIAASAGGPAALKALLQRLQPGQPWALILVQHIAPGFLTSFCQWLQSITSMSVEIGRDGQLLQAGRLYLTPDGHQVGVASDRRLRLEACQPEQVFCPSADYLFHSVARTLGRAAIGVQLSGMGRDGAVGLAELKRAGALTLVQAPSDAVIDSMPLAAIDLQAACEVMSAQGIAEMLNTIAVQLTT